MGKDSSTLEQAHELALLWIRGQDTSSKTPEEFMELFLDARARMKAKLGAQIAEKSAKWCSEN